MLDCLVGECNANCLTCFSCPCSYDVGDVLIRLQKIIDDAILLLDNNVKEMVYRRKMMN